jgi:predicted RNase H-like HicB family nuclease
MKETRLKCSPKEEWIEGYFLTIEQLEKLIKDYSETYFEPIYNLKEWIENHLKVLNNQGEIENKDSTNA